MANTNKKGLSTGTLMKILFGVLIIGGIVIAAIYLPTSGEQFKGRVKLEEKQMPAKEKQKPAKKTKPAEDEELPTMLPETIQLTGEILTMPAEEILTIPVESTTEVPLIPIDYFYDQTSNQCNPDTGLIFVASDQNPFGAVCGCPDDQYFDPYTRECEQLTCLSDIDKVVNGTQLLLDSQFVDPDLIENVGQLLPQSLDAWFLDNCGTPQPLSLDYFYFDPTAKPAALINNNCNPATGLNFVADDQLGAVCLCPEDEYFDPYTQKCEQINCLFDINKVVSGTQEFLESQFVDDIIIDNYLNLLSQPLNDWFQANCGTFQPLTTDDLYTATFPIECNIDAGLYHDNQEPYGEFCLCPSVFFDPYTQECKNLNCLLDINEALNGTQLLLEAQSIDPVFMEDYLILIENYLNLIRQFFNDWFPNNCGISQLPSLEDLYEGTNNNCNPDTGLIFSAADSVEVIKGHAIASGAACLCPEDEYFDPDTRKCEQLNCLLSDTNNVVSGTQELLDAQFVDYDLIEISQSLDDWFLDNCETLLPLSLEDYYVDTNNTCNPDTGLIFVAQDPIGAACLCMPDQYFDPDTQKCENWWSCNLDIDKAVNGTQLLLDSQFMDIGIIENAIDDILYRYGNDQALNYWLGWYQNNC